MEDSIKYSTQLERELEEALKAAKAMHMDDDKKSEEEKILNTYKEQLISECIVYLRNNTFSDFVTEISQSVIGQDNLELLLAGIYNYISGIAKNGHPAKINTLLTAPSGCGKTETYRAIKSYFKDKIPTLVVELIDVSRITPEGFKGSDINTIIASLLSNDTRGYGIIFMDELDKRVMPQMDNNNGNISSDVQGQLFTMLEGTTLKFKVGATLTEIDTGLTMFIGCGSFNSIREKKKARSNKRNIGFSQQAVLYDIYDDIKREDMIDAGCIYEMLGRFSLIVNYHKLGQSAILKIIEKARANVSTALNLNIKLSTEYIDKLITVANGDFGCRLIYSCIYETALRAYVKSLKLNTCSCPVVFINENNDYEISEPIISNIEVIEDIEGLSL